MFCLLRSDTLQELFFICPSFWFKSFAFMDVVIRVFFPASLHILLHVINIILGKSHNTLDVIEQILDKNTCIVCL